MFDYDHYLQRIGLAARVQANEVGLQDIHRHQVYSLAFENFDIQLGRQIALDEAALFTKMVRQRRGGYCFELNGLLQFALSRFGFQSRPLLARVHVGGDVSGRAHQLLLVTINGREWLADAGFGANGLRAPIPFELEQEQSQDGHTYRLTQHELYGTMLQLRADDDWQELYSFDLTPVFPADIEQGYYFTSNHPKSFFNYTRVAARPNPDGRVTLANHNMTIYRHGVSEKSVLPSGAGYIRALNEHFGIELDAAYADLKPVTDPVTDIGATAIETP